MYFCKCPKCGGINVNEDLTKTIIKIHHKENCPYVKMGIRVTFNAEEITELNKHRIYDECKADPITLEMLKGHSPERQI